MPLLHSHFAAVSGSKNTESEMKLDWSAMSFNKEYFRDFNVTRLKSCLGRISAGQQLLLTCKWWLVNLQVPNTINQMAVGTGGSPKNSIVWWSKCNKTPLFTGFSAHTQIASMLMLREHMSCLFATIRRFFMTCVDTFSSQHIETA